LAHAADHLFQPSGLVAARTFRPLGRVGDRVFRPSVPEAAREDGAWPQGRGAVRAQPLARVHPCWSSKSIRPERPPAGVPTTSSGASDRKHPFPSPSCDEGACTKNRLPPGGTAKVAAMVQKRPLRNRGRLRLQTPKRVGPRVYCSRGGVSLRLGRALPGGPWEREA
jgi:hypothetical protein